tara:strand:- start:59 stop:448 length:390 start_codon:yes stop_codon:yes gene_type:complete
MKNNKYELIMTGKQAVKHVTELKRNPDLDKVYICHHATLTHLMRTEVSDSGLPRDDTYADDGWTIPGVSLELTWKQFLAFCDESDRFSELKKKRFEEVGYDNSSAEFGTGIRIGVSVNEEFRHAMVWVS